MADINTLTQEGEKEDTYAVLIYGDKGKGKTTSLASLPGRVLILDLDKSSKTLEKHPRFLSGEVKRIKVRNGSDIDIDLLTDIITSLSDKCDFDFVCLDNLSVLGDSFLDSFKKNKAAHATQPEYGMAGIKMWKFFTWVIGKLEGKANLVFTSWEGTFDHVSTTGEKTFKTAAKFYGSNKVEGLCGMLVRAEQDEKGAFKIRLQGDDNFVARDQVFNRKGHVKPEDLIPQTEKEDSNES